MAVVQYGKDESGAYAHPVSLDSLWNEAAALGRICVEGRLFRGGYEVSIRFDTSSGSTVYAKGIDPDVSQAFERAIAEARALGAKPTHQ